MNYIKNKCVALAFLLVTGSYACAVDFNIGALNNKSDTLVSIQSMSGKQLIVGATSVKRFVQPLAVPLIPLYGPQADDNARQAFLKDQPYFPAQALVITTKVGRFAIWSDERGLMCALEFRRGYVPEKDCIPVKIFKPRSQAACAILLRLLLSVDEKGALGAGEYSA